MCPKTEKIFTRGREKEKSKSFIYICSAECRVELNY
jgi:hypothetical protein